MTAAPGASVQVRAYGDLADFLPRAHRGRTLLVALRDRTSVKDLLESVGVPHPEIDVVVVDGEPVGFEHVVAGGERVAAYPRFESIGVEAVVRAGPAEPAPRRFVLDVHLGALARLLRLAGIDADLDPARDDAGIAAFAASEGRTVLTRDVGLLKRSVVRHGAFVRNERPFAQWVEVGRRFALGDVAAPFTRCMMCNGALARVGRDDAAPLVPDGVAERHGDFLRCAACGRVYWPGSHHARLTAILDRWLPAVRRAGGVGDRRS
jgi:uncharacterized protein with PIN domain/sulfur carrier protein ThiS